MSFPRDAPECCRKATSAGRRRRRPCGESRSRIGRRRVAVNDTFTAQPTSSHFSAPTLQLHPKRYIRFRLFCRNHRIVLNAHFVQPPATPPASPPTVEKKRPRPLLKEQSGPNAERRAYAVLRPAARSTTGGDVKAYVTRASNVTSGPAAAAATADRLSPHVEH
ncbi:hypothetical protein MTO96_001625 [Rhipicephalus appendiculatus]